MGPDGVRGAALGGTPAPLFGARPRGHNQGRGYGEALGWNGAPRVLVYLRGWSTPARRPAREPRIRRFVAPRLQNGRHDGSPPIASVLTNLRDPCAVGPEDRERVAPRSAGGSLVDHFPHHFANQSPLSGLAPKHIDTRLVVCVARATHRTTPLSTRIVTARAHTRRPYTAGLPDTYPPSRRTRVRTDHPRRTRAAPLHRPELTDSRPRSRTSADRPGPHRGTARHTARTSRSPHPNGTHDRASSWGTRRARPARTHRGPRGGCRPTSHHRPGGRTWPRWRSSPTGRTAHTSAGPRGGCRPRAARGPRPGARTALAAPLAE